MVTGNTTQPALADKLRTEVEDQRRLTSLLGSSEDPHIRLLVHISQRQLDLFEVLVDNRTHAKLVAQSVQSGFEALGTDLDEIREAVGLPPRKRPKLQLVNVGEG
jgi:hypothetical protein